MDIGFYKRMAPIKVLVQVACPEGLPAEMTLVPISFAVLLESRARIYSCMSTTYIYRYAYLFICLYVYTYRYMYTAYMLCAFFRYI